MRQSVMEPLSASGPKKKKRPQNISTANRSERSEVNADMQTAAQFAKYYPTKEPEAPIPSQSGAVRHTPDSGIQPRALHSMLEDFPDDTPLYSGGAAVQKAPSPAAQGEPTTNRTPPGSTYAPLPDFIPEFTAPSISLGSGLGTMGTAGVAAIGATALALGRTKSGGRNREPHGLQSVLGELAPPREETGPSAQTDPHFPQMGHSSTAGGEQAPGTETDVEDPYIFHGGGGHSGGGFGHRTGHGVPQKDKDAREIILDAVKTLFPFVRTTQQAVEFLRENGRNLPDILGGFFSGLWTGEEGAANPIPEIVREAREQGAGIHRFFNDPLTAAEVYLTGSTLGNESNFYERVAENGRNDLLLSILRAVKADNYSSYLELTRLGTELYGNIFHRDLSGLVNRLDALGDALRESVSDGREQAAGGETWRWGALVNSITRTTGALREQFLEEFDTIPMSVPQTLNIYGKKIQEAQSKGLSAEGQVEYALRYALGEYVRREFQGYTLSAEDREILENSVQFISEDHNLIEIAGNISANLLPMAMGNVLEMMFPILGEIKYGLEVLDWLDVRDMLTEELRGLGQMYGSEDAASEEKTGMTNPSGDDIIPDGDTPAEPISRTFHDGTSLRHFVSRINRETDGTLSVRKPPYSPNIDNWMRNGGTIQIEVDEAANTVTWIYRAQDGRWASYINGEISFPEEYLYRFENGATEIYIGPFSSRRRDRKKAERIAITELGLSQGIPDDYVVHHDYTNGIVQLVKKDIHEMFTHRGGISIYITNGGRK